MLMLMQVWCFYPMGSSVYGLTTIDIAGPTATDSLSNEVTQIDKVPRLTRDEGIV